MATAPQRSRGIGQPVSRVCPECGTEFERKLVPFEFEGKQFGYFPADVCANGHEYFPQESRAQIEELAKALRLWGLNRVTTSTFVNGETREIDFSEETIVEEQSRHTQSRNLTFPIPRPQVKKTILSAAVGA